MNKQQIEKELSLVPLAVLNGCLVGHGQVTRSDKALAIKAVADLVNSGVTSIDGVKAHKAAPIVKPQTYIGALTALEDRINAKLHEQVKQALSTANSNSAQLAVDLSRQVNTEAVRLGGDIKRLSDETKRIAAAAGKSPDVSGDIAKAVNAAFAKFRKATPKAVIEEIAASVPATETKQARDVFPVTTYRCGDDLIDFGNLNVEVWNDAAAPAVVDDYVFPPDHLHQTLVAVHDENRLPDNVWLAGERGTGKTEFVTQVAARLRRRLVRVNFDEALERADFVGGNTIANGTVVWKGGVITEAIKQQGTIILLDEVGFARAQSIAVLHALTERSPHRALVVSETGERIPVAADVCFFACDNSNGYGDTSGNFAGVREQNSAFIDRFGFTLRFQYLPADDEARLISTRTGLSQEAAEILVGFAKVAREKAAAGLLTQPPSLRQLFAWARAVKRGVPVQPAFTNAVINKFPSDCAAELLAVYTATINVSTFAAAL
jgi:cobaltochelatase CobS